MKPLMLGQIALLSLAPLWLNAAHAGDDYQQWLQGERQAYGGYLEEMDQTFANYLKEQWQAFETYSGVVRDETPKPTTLPIAPTPKATPIPQVKAPAPPSIQLPDIPQPPPPPPAVVSKERDRLTLDYFGNKVDLLVPTEIKQLQFARPANNDKIAEYWLSLGKIDTHKLQRSLANTISQLQLNDWGAVQLGYQLGATLYPDNERRILLTWFLLSKSGYNAKLGHDRNQLFLLLPTKQMIYETPYLTINNERHFIFHFSQTTLSKSLYSYQGDYPKANTILDLQLAQAPRLNGLMKPRHLEFDYDKKRYRIALTTNSGMVAFLNSYPQSDLHLYFSAATSPATAEALLSSLRPHLADREPVDAINFLLRFVQTAFTYQTDQQQFGEENYLFPDETLYYNSSDCEDRSVLFAWLVKHLLGLEVIGLNYPGHVATAILLETSAKVDSINFQGKRYVVADPTYINANLGMAMPQFKGTTPDVIPIQFN